MKLSARTVQLLKNFSLINKSMVFKRGNAIATVSPNKDIMAKATVAETFEQEFAIYEMPRFLSVLSLFKDPEIEFGTKFLTIVGGVEAVNYLYADPSLIVAPADKEIKLPNPEINFDLSSQALISVTRAMHVMQMDGIAVVGDRQSIKLRTVDLEGKKKDFYQIDVGSTSHEFNMVFKGEHLKLLSEDYKVAIVSKGIANFKGADVDYWVTTQTKLSSFTK